MWNWLKVNDVVLIFLNQCTLLKKIIALLTTNVFSISDLISDHYSKMLDIWKKYFVPQ